MNKISPISVYQFEEQQLDPPVNIFTIEEVEGFITQLAYDYEKGGWK